jgi:hypothetical protein
MKYEVLCEKSFDEEKFQYVNRIINQSYSKGLFTIEVAKFDNCGYEYSYGEIKVIEDTIFLDYIYKPVYRIENGDTIEYIIHTMCDCPLKFKYVIAEIENKSYNIKLKNKRIEYYPDRFRTYQEEYEIVNGDTINRLDKYHLKQGKWFEVDSINRMKSEFFYRDNDIENGIRKRYRPDWSLENIEKFIRQDSVIIQYFDNKEQLIKTIVR